MTINYDLTTDFMIYEAGIDKYNIYFINFSINSRDFSVELTTETLRGLLFQYGYEFDMDFLKERFNVIYSDNISPIEEIENYFLFFETYENCRDFLQYVQSLAVASALE